MAMQLILFTGLPCTGKSSLAEAVGQKLAIPVFAKDWLEATLLRHGFRPTGDHCPPLGFFGYELLTTLAERQLRLGQSAILDSVASTTTTRERWRALAASHAAGWRVIECVCSDPQTHRNRLASRRRAIPGWPELQWADVERVAASYAPWREPRLVLDAMYALEENLASALGYIASGAS
jgi:hypothetical protein